MTATTAQGQGPDVLAGWRRTNVVVRVVIVAIAAVLAVQYGSTLYGGVVGSRVVPGVPTSPYSTGPAGTAALIQLLDHVGDHVVLASGALHPGDIPAGASLFVIDPRRWTGEDRATARSVADQGGRVTFVGAAPPSPGPALASGVHVRLVDEATGAVRTNTGPLGVGVTSLETTRGVLQTGGTVRDDVVASGGVVAADSGPVSWVASSVPLRNATLDRRDDAALAWNLARPWGRTVVVDVAAMAPLARSSGLRDLPAWWQAALVLIAAAAVVWVVSAARRFGPADPPGRVLAPARVGYVDAMAALLGTLPESQVHDATAPLAAAADRALRRRLRLAPDADATQMGKDASEHGVPEWVVDAATTAPRTRTDAVATGEALSWLSDQEAVR